MHAQGRPRWLLAGGVWLAAWLLWGTAAAEIVAVREASGRLVYTNVLPAPPLSPPPRVLHLIDRVARRYGMDPALLQAIVAVESGFDPAAVSPAGAQGLMQLMPATAARYGVAEPLDPLANLDGGTRYFRDLLQRFGGDVRRALAAFHAGPGAVERHGGLPPYASTRRYVGRVLATYRRTAPRPTIYRYRLADGRILFTDTPRVWVGRPPRSPGSKQGK
ncbi:MAG: hypothetical protein KatS3mg131_0367 [Candidatus Tectimicrobiota bacterium]|nr:MAG: hypothetical protein KatS3mg131_0367 [Candidatus Tectomicrobia bacterium]